MKPLLFALTLLPTLALARAPEVSTRVVLSPGRLDESHLTMEGFARNATPGQPSLPVREVAVALHPRADLSTLRLEVRSGPTDSLPGRRSLAPNPPRLLLWPDRVTRSWAARGRRLKDGRDLDAFGEDPAVVFPAQVVRQGRITSRRGLRVLHLRFSPLRYRHRTGELLLARHTEATLRYRLTEGAPFHPDPQLAPHLSRVVNPDQARAWHRATLADSTTPPGYAIVIQNSLRQASQSLGAFIKHKEKLGFKVHVTTDKDLATIPVGPEGGDAERIRAWLQASYQPLNLRYVLLVGNPDPRRSGVPMKLTYAAAGAHSYELLPPTDHYYADLSGDWDLDGDGKVAEYPDDEGTGGIDFTPEVYVGRIPVYDDNVAALDRILNKTMRYLDETGERAWRRRVLQPAAILFFARENNNPAGDRIDGATLANMFNDEVIKPRGLTRYTLFETEGLNPSKHTGDAPLNKENVIAEWQKGYGLVTWFGHGSADAVYRRTWPDDNGDGTPSYQELYSPPYFSYDDTLQLDDTHPAFVFHGSCSNADPYSANNVAYGLLRHGAIGTVGASEVAVAVIESIAATADPVASSIFGAERDFTAGLLDNKPAGEALFYATEKLSLDADMYSWLTKLQLNLYGDPSVPLTSCAEDADCDDNNLCNGKEVCQAGQCTAGEAVACSSPEPCIEATCDPQTGKCSIKPRPNFEACDDGKFCTVNEVCIGGQCRGAPRCAAPGNPCVEAKCDEQARTCDVYAQLDGQTCHEGSERQGTCVSGICEPDDTGCAVGGAGRPLPALLLLLPGLLLLLRRRHG